MEFHELYRPLTSTPFRDSTVYRELLPLPALRPWIRCFWEFHGSNRMSTLVTPDTCMDIIFDLGETPGTWFCGIDDTTVWAEATPGDGKRTEQFAIRFYPWAAALFAEDTLWDAKNLRCEAREYFPKLQRELHDRLAAVQTLEQRAAVAEGWLLAHLDPQGVNGDVLQAAWEIVTHQGNLRMVDLSRSLHISGRQLERLFREHMGISPKKLSGLIRYQSLWRDVLLCRDFNVHDAVLRYGYTDQAHLLNDFRKYHLLSLSDARALAYGNSSLFYKTKP